MSFHKFRGSESSNTPIAVLSMKFKPTIEQSGQYETRLKARKRAQIRVNMGIRIQSSFLTRRFSATGSKANDETELDGSPTSRIARSFSSLEMVECLSSELLIIGKMRSAEQGGEGEDGGAIPQSDKATTFDSLYTSGSFLVLHFRSYGSRRSNHYQQELRDRFSFRWQINRNRQVYTWGKH